MNVGERTLIAAASVGCIALAVALALILGPREHRMLFAISGVVAVAMAFPSLFVDPRDLVASLVFAVPPVMALASDGGSAWLIGPLAVLLLVGAELNALCWASQAPSALRTDARPRSIRIGALALLGLGASTVVALAARVSWLDSAGAVAVAAGALAGLAWVVFPGGIGREGSAGTSVGVLVVLVCGGIGACTTQGEARPAAQRVDSAGVEIVLNPPDAGLPRWEIPAVPLLELGRREGGGPEEFFDLTDAMLADDTTVVVVNAGSAEIRVFGTDGSFRGSFGGRGEGPGELEAPRQIIGMPGDSFGVFDPWSRRLTVFDRSGSPGRVVPLPVPDVSGHVLGVREDGLVAFRLAWLSVPDGVERQTVEYRYRLVDARGTIADTLPTQPWTDFVDIGGVWARPHLIAEGADAWGAGLLWTGAARDGEVRQYSARGDLQRIVRWEGASRETTDADVDALLAEALASVHPSDHDRIRNEHRRKPVAERLPAYRGMVVESGSGGGVWTEAYPVPGETGPIVWTLVDTTGVRVAQVAVPRSMQVFEFREELLLGAHTDEFGVQFLRLYELVR